MFPNPLPVPFTVWAGFHRGSKNTVKMVDYTQLLCSYTYVDSFVFLLLNSTILKYLFLSCFFPSISPRSNSHLFRPITTKSLGPSHSYLHVPLMFPDILCPQLLFSTTFSFNRPHEFLCQLKETVSIQG